MTSASAPVGAWLFHLDSAGKTCFDEAEARAASELIAAMKLDERVAAAMGRVHFVFPQASTRMASSHLCNHDWFGSFELMQVTGVVRLQADADLVAAAYEEEAQEKRAKIAEHKEYLRRELEAQVKRRDALERTKRDRAQAVGSTAASDGKGSDVVGDEENAGPQQKKAKTTAQAVSDAVLAPLRFMGRVASAAADLLVPGS